MLLTAGSDRSGKSPRAKARATAVAPRQEMQWFEGDSGEDTDSDSTGPSSNTDSMQGTSGREGSVEQECIELLSDDEDEDMQEDEDVDAIEIISSDLEDDDVLLVGEVQPSDAAPAPSRPRHSVVDLCGSQILTYLEDAPTQREQYNMYIDGSHRPDWPTDLSMSAGGYCLNQQGHWFNFSCLLLGGRPNSTRAELGAIYVGCVRLLKAIQERRIDTASCEVHMHTDCQGAANVLKRKGARMVSAKKKNNFTHVITGIKGLLRQLKAVMPVRLKWVKGHQTGDCEHRKGNDQAHRRAQPNSLLGCEQLPTGGPARDEAAVKAVWKEFLKVRSAPPPARHDRRPISKKQSHKAALAAAVVQHKQMKRKGKKARQAMKKQTAAQMVAARLAGAAAQLQQLQQQLALQPPLAQQQQQQQQQQAWVQPPPPQRPAQQQQQHRWLPRLSPPAEQECAGRMSYFMPGAAQAAQQPSVFDPRPQAQPPPPAAAAWQQQPAPLGRTSPAAAVAATVQHIVVMVPVGVATPVVPQQQQPQPPPAAAAAGAPPPASALLFLHGEAQAAAVAAAAAVALPGSPVQRRPQRVSPPAPAPPKSPAAVICIDC